MAVPQRRTSPSRKRMRRAHDALKETQRIRCDRCNAWNLPHTVCENCGHYRGKVLLPVEGF